MGIFLLTPLANNADRIGAAVKAKFEEANCYELQSSAGWLVSYTGTTVELSNHLGVTGQAKGEPATIGSVLVTPVAAYYGRGPTDMWEWLKTRFEESP